MPRAISLTVNGQPHSTTTDEERPLLDVLREDFHLTGTKYGCGEGQCGACSVLIDGRVTRSCITPVGEAQNKHVLTVEGLEQNGELHRVQQAFLEQQAMQCGYCVPGQIMTAAALLRDKPNASREEIVSAMSGNICRCCGYTNIRAAVEHAVSPS